MKNRNEEIVAADRHRPYLMIRVDGTNDYINAVFLDVSIPSEQSMVSTARIFLTAILNSQKYKKNMNYVGLIFKG